MLHIAISGEWSSAAEEAGYIGIEHCWWQTNLFRASIVIASYGSILYDWALTFLIGRLSILILLNAFE